jgi:hypothetical protein
MNTFWAIVQLLSGLFLFGFGLLIIISREIPGTESAETVQGCNALGAGLVMFATGVTFIILAIIRFVTG